MLILRIIWLKIFYFYITLFDNIDVCWDTVCHRAYPVSKAEISQKILFSLFLYDLHRTVSEFMLFCVCSFTPLCFELVSKTKTRQVWQWIKRGWRSLIEEIQGQVHVYVQIWTNDIIQTKNCDMIFVDLDPICVYKMKYGYEMKGLFMWMYDSEQCSRVVKCVVGYVFTLCMWTEIFYFVETLLLLLCLSITLKY